MRQGLSQFKPTRKTVINSALILLAVFCLWTLLAPAVVFAQDAPVSGSAAEEVQQGLQVIEQPLGLPATDIRLIVARIIRIALGLLGLVLLGLILYAGYLWMTAGGNDEQILQAKKFLRNAVIGLAIILSAYALVTFIMRLLGVGVLGPPSGPGARAQYEQNFSGSGALGRVIRDHYPRRDQTDVPRNTRIAVTFSRPVKPDSFIINKNQDRDPDNQTYGDCINEGTGMSWEFDCDAVDLNEDKIYITRADTGEPIAGAAILAPVSTVNGVTGVYTIIIRPYDYLGSDTEKVPYQVRLGNDIKLDDPENGDPSIFVRRMYGNDYYEWRFTCSTELDFDPPQVLSVWPRRGRLSARNTVIQASFDEPVDPVGLQGAFKKDGANNYFTLDAAQHFIYLTNEDNLLPAGDFNLVNGYQTAEFTPAAQCGVNACGNPIYCLPVADQTNAANDYELLLKAGAVINTSTWEAFPLSGIVDMAGNALDGNGNNRLEVATSALSVFPAWKEADNFFWNFTIENRLDATAPYLNQITPGPDQENVAPLSPLNLLFSKRMRLGSLYNIVINEYPEPENGIPLWKVPYASEGANDTTLVDIHHGPFLDAARQYYFPAVTSTVEDVNFNCFYPGLGPGDPSVLYDSEPASDCWAPNMCGAETSPVCDADNPANCCGVTENAGHDWCCNGVVWQNAASYNACLGQLRANSPLPE